MEQINYKILDELSKEDNHIRNLAKKLNVNHMTISRKINLLEEENVLDYKFEGKNKVYQIKNSLEAKERLKMMEHYKLIQTIKENPRLRKIATEIKKTNIELAILFGSYAKGTSKKDSDIDIYIDKKEHKEKIEGIDTKISIKYGKFQKNNLLAKEIIKNHVIIKGVENFYEKIRQNTN